MKTLFTLFIILSITIHPAMNQENDTYRTAPFQISLIPPLSTNGIYAAETVNDFSVNIFAGISAGTDGFEAGGFLNINKDFVYGAQFSGFGNIVGNNADAFQAAGFMNLVGGSFHGFQAAGFTNLNTGFTEAAQVAGFINTSGDLNGFQAAGFGNYANTVDGVQIAGFMNASKTADAAQIAGFGNFSLDVDGAQVAGFINAADDVDGAQIAGFINVADNVDGLQLSGFINICDSIDGIPIGIINIVRKNGYRRFELWSNETHFLNLSYRMGVRQFYTIFTGSMRPTLSEYRWAYGLGLGTALLLNQTTSLEIEGLAYYLPESNFRSHNEYNGLYKLRLNAVYDIVGTLSVFAGPSFNILVSEDPDGSLNNLIPGWSFRMHHNRHQRVDSWVGFHAGVRF